MNLKPLHSLLIYRCCFIGALSLITVISLIDLTELLVPDIWDKLEHASAFLLLSFLLDKSLPQYHQRLTLHPAQIMFLLCYGVSIEGMQSYTPTREASRLDVVADITGIFLYWLIYFKRHTKTSAVVK